MMQRQLEGLNKGLWCFPSSNWFQSSQSSSCVDGAQASTFGDGAAVEIQKSRVKFFQVSWPAVGPAPFAPVEPSVATCQVHPSLMTDSEWLHIHSNEITSGWSVSRFTFCVDIIC